MATYDNTVNPYPFPLYLSSEEMQLLLSISLHGIDIIEKTPDAKIYLQKLSMSLVANLRVKELDPDQLPPPASIHVTTLYPVADA
ncbi:MAG: hypothetical protein V3T17_12745 [Pseudomonadales bacterium]